MHPKTKSLAIRSEKDGHYELSINTDDVQLVFGLNKDQLELLALKSVTLLLGAGSDRVVLGRKNK